MSQDPPDTMDVDEKPDDEFNLRFWDDMDVREEPEEPSEDERGVWWA